MKGSAMMVLVAFLSKHHFVVAALLLVTVACVVGCGGEANPLTVDSLKNARYHGIGVYPEGVKLTDGQFEGYYVVGGSLRSSVVFVEPCAFWDLDGDGLDDAAVFLKENTGGSGIFVYLAAVLNQNGKPVNVATTRLSSPAQIEGLAVEGGQITVRMLNHSPGDPMCCPSEVTKVGYALEGGDLIPLGKMVNGSQQ
jgi:hypothetical protein